MITISQKLKTAPKQPGCYLFKNQAGKVIYIGKAKNLKNRVNWYFKKENQDAKTKKLVSEIKDVEFFVTDNELESLILEAELIRKNQPKYNVELKNGVRYAYIKLTDEIYPRLLTVRIFKKKDKVFGPYTSGLARQEIIRLANRLFKLRINKRMSKKEKEKGRIRLSTAPWLEEVSQAEYQKRIEKAVLLLKGQNNELIEKLESEMKKYIQDQNYELAKNRR